MVTSAKMAESICNESDVPPLEDMTEVLQRAMQFKEHRSTSANLAESQPSNNSLQHTTANAKPLQTNKVIDKSKPSTAAPMQAQSFAGMKKGFLFGGGSKSTKSSSLSEPVGVAGSDTCSEITSTHEDLPFIKPSNESSENRFQFDEVQQALKVNDAFLTNKDWLTDDLLKRIQSNADLSQRLLDPTFMHAITEFQTNPQAAMYKYRDNDTMQTFFKDFCALLGDHFTSLASSQPTTTNASNGVQLHSPEGAADITVARQPHREESQVQEILANTELREILLDSKVQKLLEALRTDPEKAQRMLQQSDAEQRYKINRLIDAGLLQFQH